jgi:hypothetical protein
MMCATLKNTHAEESSLWVVVASLWWRNFFRVQGSTPPTSTPLLLILFAQMLAREKRKWIKCFFFFSFLSFFSFPGAIWIARMRQTNDRKMFLYKGLCPHATHMSIGRLAQSPNDIILLLHNECVYAQRAQSSEREKCKTTFRLRLVSATCGCWRRRLTSAACQPRKRGCQRVHVVFFSPSIPNPSSYIICTCTHINTMYADFSWLNDLLNAHTSYW